MTSPKVPPLAVWLLAQLAPGPNDDALIGDLTESLACGRSRLWLWRQIVTAFAVKLLATLRSIPLLAATTVVSGLILSGILLYGGMIAWGGLAINMRGFHFHPRLMGWHEYFMKCQATLFAAHVIATAVISSFNRKHRVALVSAWTLFSLLWGCGWMIYFFQDPVRRYATIQLEAFGVAILGELVGALLSLSWIYYTETKSKALSM